MKSVGGNIQALMQIKSSNGKNAIGEEEIIWSDVGTLTGWLDYSTGQASNSAYQAKVQNSTHLFFCDYKEWKKLDIPSGSISSDNGRVIIAGKPYALLYVDDPMEMHQHLEIYLEFLGGGLGVN